MSEFIQPFPQDLDLAFDPKTNRAWISHTDVNDVVIWDETEYTYFIDNFIDGPDLHQKAGICAFATKDTADKMVKFVKKVTGFGSEIVETNWDIYKVVNTLGQKVPQYQIHITKDDGSTKDLNAGLLARSVIISEVSAASNLKSELGLS